MRIPKAGSSALVYAMQAYADIPPHEHTLPDVQPDQLAFVVVRDPVDRFRSAYDMYWNDGTGDMARRFPTVDAFVDAGPDEWLSHTWGSAFWPMTTWLRSAEYVAGRAIIVMPIETFADDLAEMGFRRPPISHAAVRRHEITRPWSVRTFYADDYRMLEALCPPS